MKSIIAEYLPLKDNEKSHLWENCVFVFDANVLLNLYRYSRETTNALLGALETLSPRIWIPYQVAFEFMRRRCNVIYDTLDKYVIFESKVQTFLSEAKGLANLSDSDSEIIQLKNELNSWIEVCKDNNLLVSDVNNDFVLDHLLDLFDERTGRKYSAEEEAKLFIEGERRYKSQIPPGYRDYGKKVSDSCDNNAFGDFILWCQTMDYAREKKKSVILVTNDRKDDWWYEVKGKTVGPRTELLCEFRTKTKQQFHMYTMDSFLRIFNEKNNRSIKDGVIEEVMNNFYSFEELNEKEALNLRFLQTSDTRYLLKDKIASLENELTRDNLRLNLMLSLHNRRKEKEGISFEEEMNFDAQVNNLISSITSSRADLESLKNELRMREELNGAF